MSPTSVEFWANLGTTGRPTRLGYTFSANTDGTTKLVETRTAPAAGTGPVNSWPGPALTRIVVSGFKAPGSVFSYWTSSGAQTTDPAAVAAVMITLPVRTENTLGAATTSARTTVYLPNTARGR